MKLSYSKKDLKDQINSYIKTLPKNKFTSSYTTNEIIMVKNCVINVYSELEYFIEKFCEKLLDESLTFYNSSKKINKFLGTLIFRTDVTIEYRRTITLETYINHCVRLYKSNIISMNNGISEDNLIKMFKLLGIDEILDVPSLNMDFINDINTFTKTRGFFAHNSISDPQTITKVNPKIIKQQVKSIIDGFNFITNEIKL